MNNERSSHPQGPGDEQTGISWDGKCWRVTDYALICQIASDQEHFLSRPLYAQRDEVQELESMLFEQAIFLDGEQHQAIRRVLDAALVQMLFPRSRHLSMIRSTCTSVIREMKSQGSTDLVHLATALTDIILSRITGIPLLSQEMREGADAVADWTSGHKKKETREQIEQFKEHLLPLLAKRRQEAQWGAQEPGDLLDFLLDEELFLSDEMHLSRKLVLANAMMLAAAGRHAVRNTLTEGVWRLLQEGDLWQRLQDAVFHDPGVLHPLLERLLCLVTPTTFLARWAIEAIVLGGHHVEPGHKLVLDLETANRTICSHLDPTIEEASRPLPRPHLSFGPPSDPHFCVGARLSREVLRHTLLTLLQEMPTLRLVKDEEPVRSSNTTIGGIVSLPVCWQSANEERCDVTPS